MSSHIVTLGDASLTTDDLSLLVPPQWMNDNLISFWFEHLRLAVISNDPRVLLLPPNISFFISLTTDDHALSQIATAQNFQQRHLIISTVNDCRMKHFPFAKQPAGTHWSLLIYERSTGQFYYLDSLPGTGNRRIALESSSRLAAMLNLQPKPPVILDVPKQTNSYDCGAYTCVFAYDALLCFLKASSISTLYTRHPPFSEDHVKETRQSIGKIASNLFNEQQS